MTYSDILFRLMNEEVRANLVEANQVVLNCPDGVDLDPIHSFLSHAQLTIAEYQFYTTVTILTFFWYVVLRRIQV